MEYTELAEEHGISEHWGEFENYVLTPQSHEADYLLIDLAPKMFAMLSELERTFKHLKDEPESDANFLRVRDAYGEVNSFISRLKFKLAIVNQ